MGPWVREPRIERVRIRSLLLLAVGLVLTAALLMSGSVSAPSRPPPKPVLIVSPPPALSAARCDAIREELRLEVERERAKLAARRARYVAEVRLEEEFERKHTELTVAIHD